MTSKVQALQHDGKHAGSRAVFLAGPKALYYELNEYFQKTTSVNQFDVFENVIYEVKVIQWPFCQ